MNVLIAGGDGFLGRKMAANLLADGHRVVVLTRRRARGSSNGGPSLVQWDGATGQGWGHLIDETDVVVNLAGRSLATWPWTRAKKKAFRTSRTVPGRALAAAILGAQRRPRVFVQNSGIGHYGLRGEIADESTPPADDFLACLTIELEEATKAVEDAGVRRLVTRSAVVLDRSQGMLPIMAMPTRLFMGGPIASGRQAMAWIHHADWVRAVRFLVEREEASGAFNLIAPTAVSNADFNHELARRLRRPCWLPLPRLLAQILLGQMSIIITEGRYSRPRRLLNLGFEFRFPDLADALANLYF
jgi:uncharacterized protein (TIGR01777 family)